MPPGEIDDLMARLADGERSVFTRVFELLHGPVQRLCSSLLKNEADAADAAQEAMQKVFTRASDYDRSRPAMPWALAIAGWECRTLSRKAGRRRETPEQDADQRASANADDDIVQRDLTQAAIAALGELSEADRETLIATFWDEAASVSGSTLRKRRERAVTRLRNSFRRLYGLD
jgi:RNA polymerase sigma-70 factor (ECF subfamily)